MILDFSSPALSSDAKENIIVKVEECGYYPIWLDKINFIRDKLAINMKSHHKARPGSQTAQTGKGERKSYNTNHSYNTMGSQMKHSHPFNYQATENLLRELRVSLQDIQSIVEKSKQSLAAANKPSHQQSSAARFRTQGSRQTNSRNYATPPRNSTIVDVDSNFNGTSTTINFNISYSISMDEDPLNLLEKSPSPIRAKQQAHHPEPKLRVLEQDELSSDSERSLKKLSFVYSDTNGKWQDNVKQARETQETRDTKQEFPKNPQSLKWKPKTQVKVQSKVTSTKHESKNQQKQVQNIRKPSKEESIAKQTLIKKPQQDKTVVQKPKEQKRKVQQPAFQTKPVNLEKANNKSAKKLQIDEGLQDYNYSLEQIMAIRRPPDVERFMLTEEQASSLNNTCTKNQLQNLLHFAEKNTPKKWQSNKNYGRISGGVKSGSPSYWANFVRQSKSIEKSVSPAGRFKTPTLTKASPHLSKGLSPSVNSQDTGKKPNYIVKYLNKVQSPTNYKNKRSPTPTRSKSRTPPNNIERAYKHPTKSPQNRSKQNTQRFVMEQHLATAKSDWNRQSFMEQMSKQCYVQRFLNQNELSLIYQELYKERVPKYLWVEKVIQKIFNKIHSSEELI